MKSASLRAVLSGLVLLCAICLPSRATLPAYVPPMFGAVSDYSYSWWAHGLRDSRLVLDFQTSQYAMQFDVPSLKLIYLAPITLDTPEAAVLAQRNGAAFGRPNASLACVLHSSGRTYQATGASNDYTDCHLIESGKFLQRRVVNGLTWQAGCPKLASSLEIAAWPDRLTLLLRITPEAAIKNGEIELKLTTPPAFSISQYPSDAKLTRSDSWTQWSVRLPVDNWSAGEERSVAMLISRRSNPDKNGCTVTAEQMGPTSAPLKVTYDPVMGWHQVELRNDNTGQPPHNDRMERVRLVISNPSNAPRVVRLNFAKGLPLSTDVFGITGITAMLRDLEGHPLGIPIQISKNWHTNPGRYRGPWYHGVTMVALPPMGRLYLEYTSVNAFWGGVPAASHSQLCLVGWGNNQLWEEAALGAWGESICFEPDQGQVGGAVLDTRPLMVSSLGKEPKAKWGWTANVGGADFLVYYDSAGKKQWNSSMKTMHRRTGPVLTDVVYAGESQDGNIGLRYSASLYRTDDITRGVYRFRYDVRKPTPFSRLVLFQCGGDDYSYTGERKFALGNEFGLTREWNTTWGGNTYRTSPVQLTGRVPWVSMHEAVSRAEAKEAWANRGIVIRSWTARLGGSPAKPWAAERGAHVRGADTSLIDILPPPYVKRLEPGDYVECEIEHVIVPQLADDYYGPNANLKAALQKHQNTWQMIHREALGNDLSIQVTRGKLLRNRPTTIQAISNIAEFAITGGLGYTPVTFTGLTSYRGPVLEINDGAGWKVVEQAVHGKDYWQTDFNPSTNTWEITYSVPMDTPADARVKRMFRFRVR